MSIAMSCNVYNDAIALRGLLETASQYFDELFVIHSSPGMAYSTDGTIELCEQFNVKLVFDDMDKGYGVVRSRLIHDHGCEWAMILDADERFHPISQYLTCEGSDRWDIQAPLKRPDLTVVKHENKVFFQGQTVKELMQHDSLMAIRTMRRHWMDFSHKNPTSNWAIVPDYQLRIVRNVPEINYRADIRMHERIIDDRAATEPVFCVLENGVDLEIFHDHYHVFFRNNFPNTKEFNEQNYKRLERGEKMIPKS
jgi:hypothetical protein